MFYSVIKLYSKLIDNKINFFDLIKFKNNSSPLLSIVFLSSAKSICNDKKKDGAR